MKQMLWQGVAKLSTFYKKIAVGLTLAIVILMPEEVAHTLLELVDLGYEGISFILEELIQHVFHVNKFITQSIVFYLWLGAALFALYYLWHALPGLYRRLKRRLIAGWLSLADFWQGLTLIRKISFVAIYATGLYLFFSLFI